MKNVCDEFSLYILILIDLFLLKENKKKKRRQFSTVFDTAILSVSKFRAILQAYSWHMFEIWCWRIIKIRKSQKVGNKTSRKTEVKSPHIMPSNLNKLYYILYYLMNVWFLSQTIWHKDWYFVHLNFFLIFCFNINAYAVARDPRAKGLIIIIY